MRYDDPARPRSVGAEENPMQVSGSPLPVVTLIRPMESEGPAEYRCSGYTGESGHCLGPIGPDCEGCSVSHPPVWGWLACIHPHVEGSRFSYRTAWLRSVDEFLAAWLEDPEAALARYFKYFGPEPRKPIPRPVVEDLWSEDA